jgi:hypothetical protein
MPIHVTFAQHVRNAAFAALFNARAKIKGDNRVPLVAKEIDEVQLSRSGEERRRQSSVKDTLNYMVAMTNFANENPPAIDMPNFMDLTKGEKMAMVENFFATNAGSSGVPQVYFIRHKKRSQLKRVELCLYETISGDAEMVAALWLDA